MANEAIVINLLGLSKPMFRPVPIEREPCRKNRFIVEFPEQFGLESFLIQSINKPKLQLTKSNNYEWSNITLDVIDTIGPSSSKAIFRIIKFCKKEKNKKWFLFKQKPDVLFSILIKNLDPVGIEIERWAIDVKDVISADFGDLNYNSDDIQKCTIVLKPFNCILR